jgi:hypothetical protein
VNAYGAVAIALILIAPNAIRGQPAYGIGAGITTSWAIERFEEGGSAQSNQNRSWFTIRGYGAREVLPWVSTRLELGYIRKGFNRTQPTYSLDYLEGVASLQVHPPISLRPFAEVGIAPALNVLCRVEVNSVDGFYNGSCGNIPFRREQFSVSRLELSYLGGIGLSWRTSARRWTLGARFQRGVTRPYVRNRRQNELVGLILSWDIR